MLVIKQQERHDAGPLTNFFEEESSFVKIIPQIGWVQTFVKKSASNTWRWFQTLATKKGGKNQRNKQEVGKCDISSISYVVRIQIPIRT